MRQFLNERNTKSVSVSFPEACWMKTKKGMYDFAFNLQEVITENHKILAGILLSQSNGHKTIKNVLYDIFEIINLFIEMQREFGERRNYSEIRRGLREHVLIADSGYFSTENLHYLFKNKINVLIMPKILAEAHNNKLRREECYEEKGKNSSKKDFKRVKMVIYISFWQFYEINRSKTYET